jgi:glycosyltransferase involved in cell wall biosynthesis
MFENKTVGVIVPAYNEQLLIGKTLTTIPDFVDQVIVVNDGSKDQTEDTIQSCIKEDSRILLINHPSNLGLGQALITGYLKAKELKLDVTAVMAGDAQMSPDDLATVVAPIACQKAHYTKGNRLLHPNVFNLMPKHRFFGNNVLTLLTKFATGYWHIIDPQCGYTAISEKALASIPIHKMIKGYGYNAHILNMLNLNNFTVLDVEVQPVYGSEKSKIKLINYIPTVSFLLIRLFLKRLSYKYLIIEFHPLLMFYSLGFFNGLFCFPPLLVRTLIMYIKFGYLPTTTMIIMFFCFNIGLFSLFFGMWLDLEDNRKLIGQKTNL